MKKVITINLNGRAYQVEEPGYDALQHYLKQAEKKLAHDPDKEEVLADFEQAIAEKCDQFLEGAKTVVTAEEVAKIITDMGPVEVSAADEQTESAPAAAGNPPRRLFLIGEGSMIGGVCTGLAAYFNIDVNVVRLAFIILSFLTSGAMILIYLLMMFLLPEAKTPEEKAEARGDRYTAQDVLERARSKYAEVSSRAHWDRVSNTTRPAFTRFGSVIARAARFVLRAIAALTSVILAMLSVAWIATTWSIVTTNRVCGYTIDPHFSRLLFGVWAAACFLVVLVPVLSILLLALWLLRREPVRGLQRWAQYGIGLLWCVALALSIAIPLTNSSQIRDMTTWNGTTSRKLDLGARTYCFTRDADAAVHEYPCAR